MHDKLQRGNTPNVQSTAAWEDRAFGRKRNNDFWKIEEWKKKELPVLLRDKDGMWMNAQHVQQICFNIQGGIFMQIQVHSAHKLKNWSQRHKKLFLKNKDNIILRILEFLILKICGFKFSF